MTSETNSKPATFVATCLAGDALLHEVDDWVERWHTSDDPAIAALSMYQYLGFSSEEGALWSERPESLRFIIAAHRSDRTVVDIIGGQDKWARAARAASHADAESVVQWLRQTNRL